MRGPRRMLAVIDAVVALGLAVSLIVPAAHASPTSAFPGSTTSAFPDPSSDAVALYMADSDRALSASGRLMDEAIALTVRRGLVEVTHEIMREVVAGTAGASYRKGAALYRQGILSIKGDWDTFRFYVDLASAQAIPMPLFSVAGQATRDVASRVAQLAPNAEAIPAAVAQVRAETPRGKHGRLRITADGRRLLITFTKLRSAYVWELGGGTYDAMLIIGVYGVAKAA